MNSIKLAMTAQSPSAFGMPISGHPFGVTTWRATDVCTAATVVVRERAGIAVATGAVTGLGLAQSLVPGTSAWRPPTC